MDRPIAWHERLDLLHKGLTSGGALLVVPDGHGRANAMTIGWAQVGILWNRPVVTVLVRKSRHTHACIRAAASFTVSVPRAGTLSDALALCGSKSGRDLDKIAASGLSVRPGRVVEAPVIEGCALYYEGRIIARTQQELADFDADDVTGRFYPKGDPHLVVFGELVAAYLGAAT